MTAVSALAIRVIYPDARIVVLMDPPTHRALANAGAELLRFTESIVVPTAFQDPIFASRAIKVGLRETLAGDLLFLDSDTLLVRPFPDDLTTCRQAAMADDHWDRSGRPALRLGLKVQGIYREAGWAPPARYYNTGVIWLPDSPVVHRLCERWRERWAEVRALGRHNDQPALNAAIADMPESFRPLPGAYNVAVGPYPELIRTACIYHFWAESTFDHAHATTLLEHLVAHYRSTGELDERAIARARRRRLPWMRPVGVRRTWRAGAWGALAFVLGYSLLRRVGVIGQASHERGPGER